MGGSAERPMKCLYDKTELEMLMNGVYRCSHCGKHFKIECGVSDPASKRRQPQSLMEMR